MAEQAKVERRLPLVGAAGFEIVQTERLEAGTVDRVLAPNPAGE
jgi:hypothetical protein